MQQLTYEIAVLYFRSNVLILRLVSDRDWNFQLFHWFGSIGLLDKLESYYYNITRYGQIRRFPVHRNSHTRFSTHKLYFPVSGSCYLWINKLHVCVFVWHRMNAQILWSAIFTQPPSFESMLTTRPRLGFNTFFGINLWSLIWISRTIWSSNPCQRSDGYSLAEL